jgi:homoserine kinase
MHKIKIRLPATVGSLGPGVNCLTMAIGLYATVEISARADDQITLEASGEKIDRLDTPLRHPVILGMARFFQQMERAVLGYNVRVDNQIPLGGGLGAEEALMMAGVLGANYLLDSPHKRDDLLAIGARVSRAESVVAAMLGGLAVVFTERDRLIYRPLAIKAGQIVLALPKISRYSPPAPTERVRLEDALANLARMPLLIEALREGNLKMLGEALEDRLHKPRIAPSITGYGHVEEMARRSGAQAVTLVGNGPALLAFTESRPERVAEAMRSAFESAGVTARTWVLPVDTQGVVISAAQSAG